MRFRLKCFVYCSLLVPALCLNSELLFAQSTPGGGGVFGGGGGRGGGGGFGGGGRGGGGPGGGGFGGGGNGFGGNFGNNGAGGILIDAKGVISPIFSKRQSSKLEMKRLAALSKKYLGDDIHRKSPLRKISLVKLEKACEEYARKKIHVPLDIQFLAGLQRVEYVFVFPEEKDIVIAGPAEGFVPDSAGRYVGINTGRPPIRIDDLVVALRSIRDGDGTIGCSIDPVPERLASLETYVKHNNSPSSVKVAQSRYVRMKEILGMNDVTVWGVPSDSHFAQTLVEADYRMKRVSMGLEPSEIKGFRSHLAMLPLKGNSMQRWWFTPLYDAFQQSDDENAFRFAGQRAQLLSQEEKTDAIGSRSDAAFTRITTKKFAKQFTNRFEDMVRKKPIFAELQNLIDLSILAALLKKYKLPEKVEWEMELFLDKTRATLVSGYVPRQVPSMVNYTRKGRRAVIGLVGGGVILNPELTIRQIKFEKSPRNFLGELQKEAKPDDKKDKNHWWWD